MTRQVLNEGSAIREANKDCVIPSHRPVAGQSLDQNADIARVVDSVRAAEPGVVPHFVQTFRENGRKSGRRSTSGQPGPLSRDSSVDSHAMEDQ